MVDIFSGCDITEVPLSREPHARSVWVSSFLSFMQHSSWGSHNLLKLFTNKMCRVTGNPRCHSCFDVVFSGQVWTGMILSCIPLARCFTFFHIFLSQAANNSLKKLEFPWIWRHRILDASISATISQDCSLRMAFLLCQVRSYYIQNCFLFFELVL